MPNRVAEKIRDGTEVCSLALILWNEKFHMVATAKRFSDEKYLCLGAPEKKKKKKTRTNVFSRLAYARGAKGLVKLSYFNKSRRICIDGFFTIVFVVQGKKE